MITDKELEELKDKNNARIKELIEANNKVVEEKRSWIYKYRDLEIEFDIFKAGVISKETKQ